MRVVFKKTYVEDFKTGDIQYTDEMLPLLLRVQGFVTFFDQPLKQPVEHGLRHGTHRVCYLILVTTLCYELVTDLNPWFQQVLVKIGTVATKQFGDTFTFLSDETTFSLWLRVKKKNSTEYSSTLLIALNLSKSHLHGIVESTVFNIRD